VTRVTAEIDVRARRTLRPLYYKVRIVAERPDRPASTTRATDYFPIRRIAAVLCI
jgi:hypothetical protein